jgi:hypothetical protein
MILDMNRHAPPRRVDRKNPQGIARLQIFKVLLVLNIIRWLVSAVNTHAIAKLFKLC